VAALDLACATQAPRNNDTARDIDLTPVQLAPSTVTAIRHGGCACGHRRIGVDKASFAMADDVLNNPSHERDLPIDLLDEDEQRIVLAHERAHAHYRHDRYLLAAEPAAAALPPLRALARRVNYSIERWADEAAAAICGDRRLVAITLGKVHCRPTPRRLPGSPDWGSRHGRRRCSSRRSRTHVAATSLRCGRAWP
jgi:hypothetical protein